MQAGNQHLKARYLADAARPTAIHECNIEADKYSPITQLPNQFAVYGTSVSAHGPWPPFGRPLGFLSGFVTFTVGGLVLARSTDWMGFLEQKTKLDNGSGYCGSDITSTCASIKIIARMPVTAAMPDTIIAKHWLIQEAVLDQSAHNNPSPVLSPMIQHLLGLGGGWRFAGDAYVLTALSSVIYFYGGWPFLDGLRQEVRAGNPGMMTLVGVAITAAYIYSVATVVGLAGDDFFWETGNSDRHKTSFGHWIEMKSVIGAGAALEKLAALMPDTAHLVNNDESTQEIAVNTLKGGEHLLVKPGEKIPADAIIIKAILANVSMPTGDSKP